MSRQICMCMYQSYYILVYVDKRSCGADSSLFATTVRPLGLVDASGHILWNNRSPQSIRFWHPFKTEFLKETKEAITKEDHDIKEEIANLLPCKEIFSNNQCVYIKYQLYLIVIDGKVLNALTGTKSFQACPICSATPKHFLADTNFKCQKFVPLIQNLKHGLSPLHCRLRCFEFVLHAG